MATPVSNAVSNRVLSEVIYPASGTGLMIKRAALVALGIVALAIAAKIRVPFWPVPVTMQTFVILALGAAYGMRLGVATVLGYLLIGALGFDVFTSSSAETNGLAYMMGGTGGYLVGFLLAAGVLGWLARRGWDRNMGTMAAAMVIGNAVIYVPGLLWLGYIYAEAKGWATVLDWGLWPFLAGDALKLALAALILPLAWRFVGDAKA
ncbi:MAG: biotin transporter BioY [Paracoccaceae bacterium]|nr:biotin transporter BioY [Paracoccaceae bacterium]